MSGIEIKQLRYFVAVARELHFARAADSVGIDPARLSREIRGLEQRVGVRLLWRTTRRAGLTEAGVGLLERAERVLKEVEGMGRRGPAL